MRIHKKRDGLLLVCDCGAARYMTLLERLRYHLLGHAPTAHCKGESNEG